MRTRKSDNPKSPPAPKRTPPARKSATKTPPTRPLHASQQSPFTREDRGDERYYINDSRIRVLVTRFLHLTSIVEITTSFKLIQEWRLVEIRLKSIPRQRSFFVSDCWIKRSQFRSDSEPSFLTVTTPSSPLNYIPFHRIPIGDRFSVLYR
ncbi:hypothetical protein LXL04_009561 [Taraxacum kok-saghyz]